MTNDFDIKEKAELFKDKLKNIKLCLFDCDGILTNGKIFWAGESIGFNREFNVQDGYGMKLLMRAGIKVGIITGGDSIGVKKRFELLGIDYFYFGDEDKVHAFEDIMSKSGISEDNILYMGDEYFDLPLLKRVGFSATTPIASHHIKDTVDYITFAGAGDGAAREVIDMLFLAQNINPVELL